jgi:hypothetical protein
MALQHLRSSTADKRPTPGAMSDGQLAMNTNLASPGLFFKDSNGDLVKTGPVHVGTTAPNATPASGGQAGNSKGELWLDTSGSDYTLKTWDGSAWREIVVTSAMIKDGTIINADINASAAIAHTKLANITAGSVLLGNASNVPTATALSGDVTVSDAGVTAIGSGVIVNADIDASAAIAGTKISPDFGSQNVVTTGDVQSASINGGPLAGMRNAIINGNFDIWQRGTSSGAFGYQTVDRWSNSFTGSSSTLSRQSFTLGQTSVPNEPAYYLQAVVSSVAGASNRATIIQRIEDVRTFAGQAVTVSFWAKADAAKPIAVSLGQFFGTGGSPSAGVVTHVIKAQLSTAWQKFATTVSIPSISGKTIGSNDDSNLSLTFWLDAGSSFNTDTDSLGQQSGTFDIAQVQIEAGPVATPFERRPIGTELALCQRYYCKVGTVGLNRHGTGYTTAATAATIVVLFPATMRAAPTALEQSGTASDYQVTHGNTATVCSTVPAFNAASLFSAVTTFTVASGLTVGQGVASRNIGGNGYLAWGAEL